jgi:hypothetical protein
MIEGDDFDVTSHRADAHRYATMESKMSSRTDDEIPTSSLVKLGAIAAFVILACAGGGMYGCPQYNIYSSRLSGEAELAQAEYSKKVAVQTAQAKMDSAKFEAEAEVIRAGGVAKANKIIGDSLRDNEAYLRYLFVQDLQNTHNQVIYVPTEGQLPILEATRPIAGTPAVK